MNIANGMNDIDRFRSDLVGGSNRRASGDTAAGEPHGHGFGVVIATVGFAPLAKAVVRSTAELSTPDDQRVI